MNNTFKLKSVILVIALLMTSAVFAQKKKAEKNKFLEGRKFDTQFYEIKAGVRGKAVPNIVSLKSGEIQSDLTGDKLTVPPIGFKISLDSTYFDKEDSTEMHMVTFKAEYSEDKNTYRWEATVTNFEIEGTFVTLRSDVEKKRYEFSGEEKSSGKKK